MTKKVMYTLSSVFWHDDFADFGAAPFVLAIVKEIKRN